MASDIESPEILEAKLSRAKECGAGTRHRTHIGRIIIDYNIRCLCNLYFRFDCIDDNGREYQQPYFANGHQNEATKEVVL